MVPIAKVPTVNGDLDLWSALEVLERSGLDALMIAAAVPVALVTRQSAAKVVHQRVEERQREMIAQGLAGRGRFGGR
jgi:hypothetical protein